MAWRVGLIVLVLGAFVAIYGSATGWWNRDRPATLAAATSVVLKRGNYGQYTYAIESKGGQNNSLVAFDPSLPADDSVVLAAVKAVSKDAFGISLADSLQPVVEARDDTNYITFVAGSHRVWVELFRNSGGKVGNARMWVE
jgi:hypothetical protein